MATALVASDVLKCPICLEQYKEPKKLPTCQHTFCEACLVKYVSNLDDDNELEHGIPCPFCRTLNPSGHDYNGLAEWIKSLETVKNISPEDVEKNRKKNLCDSCRFFGNESQASKFCIDCFEAFCISCSFGRHSTQQFKDHMVTDINTDNDDNVKEADLEELRKLQAWSMCSAHPDKHIEYYCEDDQCHCCATCVVVNHRKCEKILELTCSTLENKAGSEMENMKDSINKLVTLAKSIIQSQKGAITTNKKQAEAITSTLQDVRAKIIKLLDALEETCSEQAKAINKEMALTQERETDALTKAINGLVALLSLIEKATKYGSVSHQVGLAENLKEPLRQYEAAILDVLHTAEYVSPELTLEPLLRNFLEIESNDTSKLANVIEKTGVSQRPMFEGRVLLENCQAKQITTKRIKENYKGRGSPKYSDLVFLLNNSVVLIDTFNGYCCLTDTTYKVITSCNIRTMKSDDDVYLLVPHSCTVIKDENVAVSAPGQRRIYILNTNDKLKVLHEINTKSIPLAVHGLQSGDLAVAWNDPVAFGIISNTEALQEKTYFCQDKSGRQLKAFDYMAVDETRRHVIQPCSSDKAVYCFDFEGTPVFKYTNASLTSPRGAAVDKDGNIYVCNLYRSCIHIFSPTGRAIRILKENCPRHPLSVAFKRNGEEFAVTQAAIDEHTVTFFKLQKP